MGYQGIMGYGVDFPLSRLGKAIILWVIRVYGLPEVWVKRVSTVCDQAYLPSSAKTTFAQIDGSTRRGRYLVGARHPPAPSQLICIRAYRSPS